jgi:hypothetical protein
MSQQHLIPPIEGIEVVHQLPHRLRLRFVQPLTSEQIYAVNFLFDNYLPNLSIRIIRSGNGLVIQSPDQLEHLPIGAINSLLLDALSSEPFHHVSLPPTPLAIFKQKLRKGGISLLMGLAIAGWILPILPGTPFFLMAWWLGWRPSEPSTDGKPPARA